MSETPKASRTAQILLIGGFVVFLGVIAFVFVSAVVRPGDVPSFEPSPIAPRPIGNDITKGQLTVDARDEHQWIFVDLARQSVIVPPDTSGWDLAFRRFDIIPSGGAIDLGRAAFDSLAEAPATGYTASIFGADTINTAIDRWYEYGFTSHILRPKHHLYVIRTADGHYAKLDVLSYYCPEVTAGCITMRYVYQPSGSLSFEAGSDP